MGLISIFEIDSYTVDNYYYKLFQQFTINIFNTNNIKW